MILPSALMFNRKNSPDFSHRLAAKAARRTCENKEEPLMKIKIGDSFSRSREVTDQLVRDFAEVSGDHNPIHLDDEFAAATRFGRRIAHGMLSAAFISGVLGNEMAERKVVYLSQTLRFTAPVFIGDTVTTTSTVKAI